MIQITAPGLPAWPKLLFDPHKRTALIVARYANWRSHQWAQRATTLLIWLVNAALACLIWIWLPFSSFPERLIVLFFLGLLLFPIAQITLQGSLKTFLARRLFAHKCVFRFNQQSILIRSPLYERPILIWRIWNNAPLQIRFHLQDDLEANRRADELAGQHQKIDTSLKQSHLLELLVSTNTNEHALATLVNHAIQRTLPIAEISTADATKLVVVCAAATLLTFPRETVPNQPSKGVDIDAA